MRSSRFFAALVLAASLSTAPALRAQQVVSDPALAAEIDRRTAAIADKVTAWRHDIHQHPELGYAEKRTAALVAAHVSISPASALDAARVASDIVLLGQDMAPIGDATRIAAQATRRIKENFAISILYNVVAVPIALVGLATPLAAALAMSLSSITVSLNALRLK